MPITRAGYDKNCMSAIARMLDANVNRAREALRVMEDAARFALDHAEICDALKSMRHDLRDAVEGIVPREGWLEANRDSPGDVGIAISTTSEMSRGGLIDVVVAAAKRLTEALRVIEELAKTIEPDNARTIESIRYRAYEIDRQLQMMLGSRRARQWKLCVLLTRGICRRPWVDVLRGAIRGGAECIQIREKQIEGGELVAMVREAIAVARPAGASVIVNDRADVALAAGADGVHLGTNDISIGDVRKMAGRELLIGASTHDLDEAAAAVDAGADYCGLGAMFASPLKPDREPGGPAYLRQFIERYPKMPHLAIGGISPANIGQLVAAGCQGVAVSTAVCAANDPEAAARVLVDAIARDRVMTDESPMTKKGHR